MSQASSCSRLASIGMRPNFRHAPISPAAGPGQHKYPRLRRRPAHRRAFMRKGDEKRPASGPGKCADNRLRAKPIGIRLHHRPGFRRRGERGEFSPVADQRAEVNRQPPARQRGVNAGCLS